MRAGLYDDLGEADYHGDADSLSASGMKLLLKAPALYRWEQDNPREETPDHFDVGTACHTKILGTGAPIAPINLDAKRGKAWTEWADAARAEGKVPLLAKQAEAVDRMAEAVLAHPTARQVLTGGQSEVSAFWHDDRWGVTRRARFDHIKGRVIGDLKTTVDANPKGLARTIVNYGYDLSVANYLEVAAGLDLDVAAMALVFVEKTPPHLVTVTDLSDDFIDRGRVLCDRALEIYRDCRDSGLWPGYVDEFTTTYPPAWATRDLEVPA